jgi:hypothetical protein
MGKIPSFSKAPKSLTRSLATLMVQDLQRYESHFGIRAEVDGYRGIRFLRVDTMETLGFDAIFNWVGEPDPGEKPHMEMWIRLYDDLSLDAAKTWVEDLHPDAIQKQPGAPCHHIEFDVGGVMSRALEESGHSLLAYLGFHNNEVYQRAKNAKGV